MDIKFPALENLCYPEHIESSPWVYYRSGFKHFYRWKLSRMLKFIPQGRLERLLEVGYGSGIALPELSGHAREVVAIDIHDYETAVVDMLDREGISNVRVRRHDIFEAPLVEDEAVDCVFSSSVVEHVAPSRLKAGFAHLASSLKPDGCLVLGFPMKSRLMNAMFDAYTIAKKIVSPGCYAFRREHDHPSGEDEIIPRLSEVFTIERTEFFPYFWFPLYMILKCKRKNCSYEN